MSTGRKIVGGSPIAFGENNTEGRIKNVLNYKKPALWVLIVASIIIVLFIIGLITNTKSNEVIEISNEQEKVEIENLVKSFGENLKKVSLMAPEEIVKDSLKDNYGEFVSPTLLEKWQKDPTNAPGRVFSSPWPERIDIVSIEKVSDYEYIVNGNIIEMTSVEMTQGGIADSNPVKLNIKKINGKWLIDDYTKNKMIPEQESVEKRFYIMTANDGAPHGCEYGTTREVGQIDTLEMLSMLGELQGFVFDEDYVSHQYIEFHFLDEEPKEIYLRYIAKDEWQTEYPIDSAIYKIKVPTKVGSYSFFADITWENGEKETVFFSIKIMSKIYKKISAFLKEEYTNAFSPYYELLDFTISDYKEEVVDGNVEAVFHYKVIEKNYDKDPDAVEYIKEAKEKGDKYYQTYYDEYLQPRESNFYFKAVIDENDGITLYTKNLALKSDEWHQVEMSDYFIKKPEETGINKNLTALEAMNLAYEEVKMVTDEEPLLIFIQVKMRKQ